MSNSDPIPLPRRAGRRPRPVDGETAGGLTREVIVTRAIALAEHETADSITIARLARELGVSTSLIHYFVGSRDELLAAALNEVRGLRAKSYPPLTGKWRQDLEASLRLTHTFQLQWKGVTTYLAENNRFRLFHELAHGERDFGLDFFDRMGSILASGGFTPQQAAKAYHLAMLFLESVAMSELRNRAPAQHRRYLRDSMSKVDPSEYPGASFMMSAFADLDTPATFESGLKVLLDAFESWLPTR